MSITSTILAQNTEYYGTKENDIAYSISEYNNNYYIVGTSCLHEKSPTNYYVLRLFKNGSIKDEYTFGETHRDVGKDIIVNSDGIYVFGKTWDGGYPNNDMILSKLDFEGKREWKKYYGGHHNDLGHKMTQLNDGNFVLVGFNRSVDDFGNVYVVKVDKNGNLIWEKDFGDNLVDHGFNVLEDESEDLLIVGTYGGFYNPTSTDYKNPDADIYVIKTDPKGQEIWSKRYGGSGHDWAKSIIASPNGGYIICGSTQTETTGSFDIFLMEIDENGNEIWFKTYGEQEFEYGEQVVLGSNNKLYILGTTASYSDDYSTDHILIKTDLEGSVLWTNTYGSDGSDYSSSLLPTSDSGCVFTGWTTNGRNGKKDIVFYKISRNGKQDILSIIPQINDSLEQILIFPNPVRDKFYVKIKSENTSDFTLELFSLNGSKVYSKRIAPNKQSTHYLQLTSGTYLYQITYNSAPIYKGKLIFNSDFRP